MKLSLSIPLDAQKEAALRTVDIGFPMSTLYAKKLEWAQATEAPQALIEEAALRGITVDELRQLIITKASEAEQELLNREALRQRIKASIRNATSEQEIDSLSKLAV